MGRKGKEEKRKQQPSGRQHNSFEVRESNHMREWTGGTGDVTTGEYGSYEKESEESEVSED